MRIDVYATPHSLTDNLIRNRTVVVIDVLRATTSMICALENGAKRIIPAADPGAAAAIAGKLDKANTLLAGESGAIKLAGFDLGNSPMEFDKDTVTGKVILFSTTNGTRAIQRATGAQTVLLGAMINRRAAAKAALEIGNDIVLVCAGTDGEFSCDDVCCAGGILAALLEQDGNIPCNDLGQAALLLYRNWKEGAFSLKNATHYSRLEKLGFEEDLKFCLKEDTTAVVPKLENGVIHA